MLTKDAPKKEGIEILPNGELLIVDLSMPRTIIVKAFNNFTGLKKEYSLKVTHKGLCLI